MKRFISIALVFIMVIMLGACGKSDEVIAVENKINDIGEVSLDNEKAILKAEKAFNALEESSQKKVENASVLTEARCTYDKLIKEKRTEEAAEIDALITKIGKVTLESDDAITKAEDAYNNASSDVQKLVKSYSVLTDAMQAFSDLHVKQTMDLINAIDKKLTSENIKKAQNSYDALSEEEKAKVTNYDKIKASESKLAKQKKDKGKAILSKMKRDEDKVEMNTFYYPSAWRFYDNGSWCADIRCFVLPYIGKDADDNYWMRLVYNYTSDDWIFWKNAVVVADGKRFESSFNYFDIVRDNDYGDVWEYIDINAGSDDLEMLRAVAKSKNAVVRLQGDNYSHDFTISSSDKASIRDAINAFDYLSE